MAFITNKNGGGIASDYNGLDNQPSINGFLLRGNKTSEQLGIPTVKLNDVSQQNFNFTSSGKALKSLRTGADEYFMPHTAEEITDKANHTQAEVNHTFYKQACKELTSAGTPITVNNGLKGYVLSAEIKGNTKVYKRLKGTQDSWVEIPSSETRDAVKYEYKLDSTQAVINNNGTLYPIYANETDKTNKKVILCGKVDTTIDTFALNEDGSGTWNKNCIQLNMKDKTYSLLDRGTDFIILRVSSTLSKYDGKIICNNFIYNTNVYSGTVSGVWQGKTDEIWFSVPKSLGYTTAEGLYQYITSINTECICELKTPQVVTIDKSIMPTIQTADKINILQVDSAVSPSSLTLNVPTSDDINKSYNNIVLLNGYTQTVGTATPIVNLSNTGIVRLQMDLTTPATGINTTLFTLPTEIRPVTSARIPVFVNGICQLATIDKTTGNVNLTSTPTASANIYIKTDYRRDI